IRSATCRYRYLLLSMTRPMTPADGGFTVLGQEQPGLKGPAFKLSVVAGVVAALAILAGTAGLAVSAGGGHKKPAKSHVSSSERATGPWDLCELPRSCPRQVRPG